MRWDAHGGSMKTTGKPLEGVCIVGTSLTPEFWRLFAILLVISAAVTFVLSAALDALALRVQRRRVRGRTGLTRTTGGSRWPDRRLVHR
ncbi:hypothetical protein [Streptomyces sp. NPDC050287]|uniref:hypothetical protein n=1 Tax=Streptomyces sp. NPDC050287 TaxID=3365608 RepID=UPI0037AF016F